MTGELWVVAVLADRNDHTYYQVVKFATRRRSSLKPAVEMWSQMGHTTQYKLRSLAANCPCLLRSKLVLVLIYFCYFTLPLFGQRDFAAFRCGQNSTPPGIRNFPYAYSNAIHRRQLLCTFTNCCLCRRGIITRSWLKRKKSTEFARCRTAHFPHWWRVTGEQ